MGTAAAAALTATQSLYDRIAPSYERWWAPVIEPAALRLLDLVAPVVDVHRRAVIVDVGAGTGPLARAAVVRWPKLRAIAVDPSIGMLGLGRAEAEESLDRSALRRLSWMPGVAERLPVEDGSADVVVSSFVYQYLRSRAAALREAHRVLRPGGVVAVVTWLANDVPFAPWRLLGEILDELHVVRPPSAETALFRSLPSAAALFRQAGFRAVRATSGLVEYQWTLDAIHPLRLGERGTGTARLARRCHPKAAGSPVARTPRAPCHGRAQVSRPRRLCHGRASGLMASPWGEDGRLSRPLPRASRRTSRALRPPGRGAP